jgi:hypothetical protein
LQARGGEDQRKVQNKKQAIQTPLKNEMGLLVDKAKPGGSGSQTAGIQLESFFFK